MERSRARAPRICKRLLDYLDVVGEKFACVLVGIGLLIFASGLLLWNEKRAVQADRSLDEGLQNVVKLPNTDNISMENNGKLVHLTGELRTEKMLCDPEFNVSIHAVKLKRVVEMYQWAEYEVEMVHWVDSQAERRKDEETGQIQKGVKYFCCKENRSDVANCSGSDESSDHSNASSMPVEARSYVAQNVSVGKYVLSEGLRGRINRFQQLRLDNYNIPKEKNLTLLDGMAYNSDNPANPKIRDVRIKFLYAGKSSQTSLGPPMMVSIIAQQFNNKLLPYKTTTGYEIELLYSGNRSAEKIFSEERKQNSVLTCVLRLGGWFIIFFGFCCLTSRVTSIADRLLFVQDIVSIGTWITTVRLAVSLYLTVIETGWLMYRPHLGLSVLVVSVSPFVMSKLKGGASRGRSD